MVKKLTGPILIVGAPTQTPDIEYASGFRAQDPVVFLHAGRHRYLVVSPLEYGRAKRIAKGVKVLTPVTLPGTPAQRRRISGWVVGLLTQVGVRSIRVPGSFPLGLARDLERRGFRVHVCKEALYPEREVKTAREIRCVRESQQAAVIAMRTAIGILTEASPDREGLLRVRTEVITAESLRLTIRKVLLERGCQGTETIVAPGLQAADPHEAGSGPIHADEPVVMDIFPQHLGHGYWGDLTRTVVRGHADPYLRRMYQAVKAAQAAALAKIKPGVQCATVHRAAAAELARRGFETGIVDGHPAGFIHSTGHGLGLMIHEGPAVSENKARLRSGHVITVEPGLYYRDVGGVRIEDTVVVTKHGWRYLAPCEKRFEI
jgi:Xaa-Pro aminopeptidase